MQTRPLGRTDISVSVIALGTMTWGEQNTEADAHAQLDYAVDRGVNLIDTAEMYAVPPRAETQGLTEEYIGNWLARSGKRDRVFLATKVTGRAQMGYLRPDLHAGETRLDRESITRALEGSLRRLKTDVIDLYQVHWPERPANTFGVLRYDAHQQDTGDIPIEETLSILSDFVRQGKVRFIGVSNETPWGVMKYLRATETLGLDRIVSIQNPHGLLHRAFEVGLSEVAMREQVGLLAYSPLAMGLLSGKYSGGRRPAGARLTLFPDRFERFLSSRSVEAADRFVQCARDHSMDPVLMACAWVNQRPYVTSNIIGATNLDQLKILIQSADVVLSDEHLKEIDAISDTLPPIVAS